MTVFLCGFMGCGKTTVGKKLAEISGRGYCDTDELIVKRAGMPIPDIFKNTESLISESWKRTL